MRFEKLMSFTQLWILTALTSESPDDCYHISLESNSRHDKQVGSNGTLHGRPTDEVVKFHEALQAFLYFSMT